MLTLVFVALFFGCICIFCFVLQTVLGGTIAHACISIMYLYLYYVFVFVYSICIFSLRAGKHVPGQTCSRLSRQRPDRAIRKWDRKQSSDQYLYFELHFP